MLKINACIFIQYSFIPALVYQNKSPFSFQNLSCGFHCDLRLELVQ